jgi:hypothetical protein
VDGFGLIIAAFSYNGQVSITTTSDSKTMPDADVFSKYIRESANELEEQIKNFGTGKSSVRTSKQIKSKSAPFFTALKKYLKDNPNDLRAYKGLYHVQVDLGDRTDGWELDLTKAEPVIKKKKNLDPKVLIEIEDENLFDLYKGKLLLEELKIQGRIKITGAAVSKTKFMKLLTAFLDR